MTDETAQAVETAATDIKKEAENASHNYLHEMLAWLKAKFSAIGLDIETELKKL